MTFSVAMCTYNGSKFIQEQLNSILSQTQPVDEIVICDDGSTDNTLGIIENIKKNTAANIRIFRNDTNLGFKKNFFKAISLCQGDIVFLSDQDDVWSPNKVDVISLWFSSHPDKNVVFTDATLIDNRDDTIDESLWQRLGFDRRKQRFFDHGYGLDIWAWRNRATGATMAFKKVFIEGLDWQSSSDAFHDKIIAIYGLTNHCLGYHSEKLIKYRLHDGQICGASYSPQVFFYSPLKPCPTKALMFDYSFIDKQDRDHIDFLQKRYEFNNSFSLHRIFTCCRSYIRQYGPWAYKFLTYDFLVSCRFFFKWLLFKSDSLSHFD